MLSVIEVELDGEKKSNCFKEHIQTAFWEEAKDHLEEFLENPTL